MIVFGYATRQNICGEKQALNGSPDFDRGKIGPGDGTMCNEQMDLQTIVEGDLGPRALVHDSWLPGFWWPLLENGILPDLQWGIYKYDASC